MNHTDSEIYYRHSYFSSTNDWLIFILGFKFFFWEVGQPSVVENIVRVPVEK